MTKFVIRGVLGVIGLVVGVVGVLALREATLSTHQPVSPSSQVEVVMEAETRHRERGQTVEEMVEALVLSCRLEISSDVVGEIEELDQSSEDDEDDDERVFRAVLQPGFDETNERQFRGCLEDWSLDQLLVDIIRIEPVAT